ncbi:hypothetical protein [Acinetobacter equi]|uniref:Uncharacterized protein n=1 Tax=Acinetobacter equi TaxID=1324350 RepID=A0A0N7GY45_9GAMM|nr:hypothetical protein [Acinetobacter equi]ALH96491.1 hypothetical protein AOY20_13585 [Acinetobacter equi]
MQNQLVAVMGRIALLGWVILSANAFAAPAGSKSVESVVEMQCLREVNDSKVWRNALIMKSPQEQSATKRAVCQCVNKDIAQNASIKAITDVDTQKDIISKAVLKSLRKCTQEILD